MRAVRPYRYRRPIWLPITLGGLLLVLITAYLLLPAEQVNAAGAVAIPPEQAASQPARQDSPLEKMFGHQAAENTQHEATTETSTLENTRHTSDTETPVPEDTWREPGIGTQVTDNDTNAELALLRRDLAQLSSRVLSLQDAVNRSLLRPGTRAQGGVMEDQRFHRVRAGETLSGIAAKHGLPTACLFRWNSLREAHVIHPGQRLRLSGDAPCTPLRTESGHKGTATAGQAGWVILAMNANQVALRPQGQQGQRVRLFTIGEMVPGAGRIINLDTQRQLVTTSQGVIHSLAH